ncbi:MAG: hypothetical protein NTW12_01865 [Deltaproteobacteria bacterium]|nr:hypothetical protein [Deltaproteobacteria bacterium]
MDLKKFVKKKMEGYLFFEGHFTNVSAKLFSYKVIPAQIDASGV